MQITPTNIHTFKQGDIVDFDMGTFKGYGKIVGQATTPVAIAGVNYIIESMDGQFPNETYPFTHLTVFECLITNHPNKNVD